MSATELEPVSFSDLRCRYGTDEAIRLRLPVGATGATVRTAFGTSIPARLEAGVATLPPVPAGTHAVELWSSAGELLAEELVNVRRTPGDDPVLAFATSFDASTVPSTLDWLRRLRCTVVQVYDWMASYSAPLGPPGVYTDGVGRSIDRAALQALIVGIADQLGAVAQAYAPVIAADPGDHADWRLVRNDGANETLGDLLGIMDPGNPEWQREWLAQYGHAVDELGFGGFHLDTYGYPRCADDARGNPVEMRDAYTSFIAAVRTGRPGDVLSFNQVNGVPSGLAPPPTPAFRYVEVWPPNDRWSHLEALMARSAGRRPAQGDTLAIYPPVWSGDREAGLRTVVLTEAITTALGIGTLIWGDAAGALRHPYYVEHEWLTEAEAEVAIDWHRFALRCRDLFRGGEDTSWYELDDENAAVTVSSSISARPEPVARSLFTRVVHRPDTIVVSLLDLSGSANGSWSEGTAAGTCKEAVVSVLVPDPQAWRADAAVLGRDGGRFTALDVRVAEHREGLAVRCQVPIVDGWSVLRLNKRED